MPRAPRSPRAVAVALARSPAPLAVELAGWVVLALALLAALAGR